MSIHQPAQDRLRSTYHKWLGSVHPAYTDGKLVAGQKTRTALEQGPHWFEHTRPKWDHLAHVWDTEPHRVFVWSDLHLFHHNILAYSGRPFGSATYMNQKFLEHAQELDANDLLIIGGDLSMARAEDTRPWIAQLTCPTYLIAGNHDVDKPDKRNALLDMGFAGLTDCVALPTQDGWAWLTHYPIGHALMPNDALNVHGHIHQALMDGNKHINMSVEHTNYRPKSLVDMLAMGTDTTVSA